MLSLIQTETVVHHGWITSAEFTNIVAISQMTPGPIGINSATYCGYAAVHNAGYGTLMSALGSLTATVALVLPSLVLMIVISRMLMKYMQTPLVQSIFSGLRPAVVGLLLAGHTGAMYCVLFVMLGHVWPVLLKFRGGKGIATSFGALLALDPLLALIELGIVAVVTLITKRMSAGSIAGLILLPVVCIFRQPDFVYIAIIIAIIMLFKHRANMIRIIHGEEPKLSILDKKSDNGEEDKK